MDKRHLCAMAFSLVAAAVTVSAENWPQWRGPLATGAAVAAKGLPEKWSTSTGENIAWKVPMPSRSGATPIVWNDTIFLNVATQPDSGDIELWSLNRKNGELVWKKAIAAGNYRINKQNMSSPSPVTDGRNVWILTGVGMLKAFDFKGNGLWMCGIQKE